MSFLKKLKLKERADLAKDFVFDMLLVKRHLYFIGASFILSFLLIQTSVPEFSITATLREAELNARPGASTAGAAQFFGASLDDRGPSDEFISNMNSYVNAQRMWALGWGSKVYGSGDLNKEYFDKIPKAHKISEKFSSFVLGHDLSEYYSAYDLQAYIRGTIRVDMKLGATNITVRTMSRNKDFAIDFMSAVILETDRYTKERLIWKSQEIISSTYKQLAVSKNASIASALASTINSEYYTIANLENDMPHLVYTIDPPHASEYPVSPNVSAIIISSAILFLFSSISLSFIQKNKEDLW